jgi:hypothetical protein
MVQVRFIGDVGFWQSQASKIGFVALVKGAGRFYSA